MYVFLKNGLEFDLVLMPTSALQVRSAHWKILTDKTGQVLSRMHSSQLEGLERQTFRDTLLDWEFEIVYAMRSILFEIERGNFSVCDVPHGLCARQTGAAAMLL